MLRSVRQGDRVQVLLTGELDHHGAIALRRELDGLIADSRVRWLILDFAQVRFMDSSGIGVVLGRYRQLRDRPGGGGVAVLHLNDTIRRIFRMAGMDRLIPILDEQEVAR